jgi:hypothetical protein
MVVVLGNVTTDGWLDSTINVASMGISTSVWLVVIILLVFDSIVVTVVVVDGDVTAVSGSISICCKNRSHRWLNLGSVVTDGLMLPLILLLVLVLFVLFVSVVIVSCSDSTGSGSTCKSSLHRGHTALRSDNHRPTHFE